MNRDFHDLLELFLTEQVDFVVVGAYALAAHGVPRATGDIDVFVSSTPANAVRVYRALARFGAPLMGIDETTFAQDDVVFQIGVVPSRIDILTSIEGVPFAEAQSTRVEVLIDDIKVPVIGLPALIKNKRACARPKDMVDLQTLARIAPKAEPQASPTQQVRRRSSAKKRKPLS